MKLSLRDQNAVDRRLQITPTVNTRQINGCSSSCCSFFFLNELIIASCIFLWMHRVLFQQIYTQKSIESLQEDLKLQIPNTVTICALTLFPRLILFSKNKNELMNWKLQNDSHFIYNQLNFYYNCSSLPHFMEVLTKCMILF